MQQIAMLLAFAVLVPAGCVDRNFRTTTETGPSGRVVVKQVPYTPEELAARDQARQYSQNRQTDPQMRAIEQYWPKLTEQERTQIMNKVAQLAAGR